MNEKKVAIYSMNWTNCYKWEYSKNKIIIIDIDTIITVGNKKRTISRYKLIQPFKDIKLKRLNQ
jgi:hypothetical protein